MRDKRALIEKLQKKGMPRSWLQSAIGLSRKKTKETEATTPDELREWKHKIENILKDTPCYGYRKVTAKLKQLGEVVNHKKVMRMMNLLGLKQKKRRVFKPKTTDSRHTLHTFLNLIQDLVPSFPNHIWVTDITYVGLPSGFCYVAIVLDVFTRKVVGWSIALHMEKELVLEALDMALKVGAPEFHHSDRGGQYCATLYVKKLEDLGVKVSMAATGVSVDNPFAESFNRTLKVEEVYMKNYESFEEAKASIKQFIEEVYHTKRLHQSLNYQTPNEFSTAWELQQKISKVELAH